MVIEPMKDILLATGNVKKAREMTEILSDAVQTAGLTVRWRLLRDFPDLPEPIEDGDTFLDNAELKAGYYAARTGLPAIADDSGLEVDALNGDPGVRSARYAGEPCDDAANNRLLVERLRGVPEQNRAARFRCAIAFSDGRRILATASGVVEGRIIDEPRGANGFGYDPHFFMDEFGMTTAEMASEQKHAISHRGRALRELAALLPDLLRSLDT